jgi:hypothetical protein
MKLRTPITTAIAAFAVAAPLAQAHTLETSGGASSARAAASYYTPAALHALSARSQAMGAAYAAARVSSTRAAASYYTPAALHALSARNQAMEAAYAAAAPVSSPRDNGFDWGYTALGAAAMLLIVVATVGSIRLTGLTKNAQQALRTS